MNKIDFAKSTKISISLGHALLAWQTLSENFGDLNRFDELDLPEKKAIWGLTDLLETILAENNIEGSPEKDWLALIEQAKDYMKTMPVDFVE